MIKTRNLLLRYFSVEDLRDLAFQMGIYPDRFPQELNPFARELVMYIQRNDLWSVFLREVTEMRPRLDWSYLERHHGETDGTAPVSSAAEQPALDLQQEANYLSTMLASLPCWEDADDRRTLLVMNGLQSLERGVDLSGSRYDAASRLMSTVLRFAESDPGFVAHTLVKLYEAIIATGLFSENRRKFLQQKIQSLRDADWGDGGDETGK